MIGINGSNGGHGGNGARSTLNVGVVGLGYWGPNLLRVLAEMPAVRVKWICDLDEQLLDGFKHRYPALHGTTNVDVLFEDPEVDAVFIATPVFTHFDLASSVAGRRQAHLRGEAAGALGRARRASS